ncbi:hypothetical protein ACFE04_015502 [Oxalis oulophora]
MAFKHRKLLSSLTSTTNCSDFCDPSCGVGCPSYPNYSYFWPPPPTSDQNNHVSLYVIIIPSIVSIGLLVLVAYYFFVVKPNGGWCNWRTTHAQPDNVITDEEVQVDHPIWFITTVGLQQRIINSITICKYKKDEGLIEGTDCSVCLNEFQEGETLRLLPKCNHAFHIPCIDTWLRSHTNCPLCRAMILVSDAATTTPLISGEQNLDSNSHIDDIQIENSGINNGVLVNQGRDREIPENRTRSEEDSEMINDLTQNQKDDVKPIRRSISVDSSFLETLILDNGPNEYRGGNSVNHIIEEEKKSLLSVSLMRNNGNSSNFRKMRSLSVARCLHKSPIQMKRSFSCRERFFSSTRSLKAILTL